MAEFIIQGGPGNITNPYLLKLLQVAEILLIILKTKSGITYALSLLYLSVVSRHVLTAI